MVEPVSGTAKSLLQALLTDGFKRRIQLTFPKTGNAVLGLPIAGQPAFQKAMERALKTLENEYPECKRKHAADLIEAISKGQGPHHFWLHFLENGRLDKETLRTEAALLSGISEHMQAEFDEELKTFAERLGRCCRAAFYEDLQEFATILEIRETAHAQAAQMQALEALLKRCFLDNQTAMNELHAEQMAKLNLILDLLKSQTSSKTHTDWQPHSPPKVGTLPKRGELPPTNNMPLSSNETFVGREDELLEVAKGLKTRGGIAIGQITAATGLGGIGKTQLAVEFVYRYGRFFHAVFWLSFADPAAVEGEIAACGEHLAMPPHFSQADQPEQAQMVLKAFSAMPTALLIFDNCEDDALLAKWRPRGTDCRIIVTSRKQHWPVSLGVAAVSIGTLPREESIRLLQKLAPSLTEAEADAIAETLGDLPLALDLAGNYLGLPVSPDVKRFLTALDGPELLDHPVLDGLTFDGHQPTRHERSLAKTFALSFNQLNAKDPADQAALAILTTMAQLAHGEPVIKTILTECLGQAVHFERGLLRVIQLGLVEGERGQSFTMHRLIALFVERALPNDLWGQALERTIESLTGLARKANETQRPAAMTPYLRHLLMLGERANKLLAPGLEDLAEELGDHFRQAGAYYVAKVWRELALTTAEGNHQPGHPSIARSQSNLALVLKELGDLEGARGLLESALASDEKSYEAGHPSIAIRQSNLALVLKDLGDSEGARVLLESALASFKAKLPQGHPNIEIVAGNLAIVQQAISKEKEDKI